MIGPSPSPMPNDRAVSFARANAAREANPPRLTISDCLIGEPVRRVQFSAMAIIRLVLVRLKLVEVR